jgi:hypothetical protein
VRRKGKMTIDDFLKAFKQVVNEFRILNEHFDSKSKSNTFDYDAVFFQWTKDMNKRYHELPITMHWGTSSNLIAKNQILFDVRHRDEYYCEIKYRFDPKIIANFTNSFQNFIEVFLQIVKAFSLLNKDYDIKQHPLTSEYEKVFSEWKREMYSMLKDTALDIHWGNKLAQITLNPLFFTVMYKDDYLFEIKHKFMDEDELNKPVAISYDFDDDIII